MNIDPVYFPATQTVYTPSGPTNACDSHAAKLMGLMAFLGTYTNSTPAKEGAECANCRHEFDLTNKP